jgi:NADH dehydrogenase
MTTTGDCTRIDHRNGRLRTSCSNHQVAERRIYLRNRLIDLLEQADFECMAGARPELLTVVIAGGGFAGTETVAAIDNFLRESVRFYPHLSRDWIRVILVHPGGPFFQNLGLSWANTLRRRSPNAMWKFD